MVSQIHNQTDISIIVSTYNRASSLCNCLQSLCEIKLPKLAQIEIIVCDDGSSDDTLAVIKSFEKQLNIRYYYQPHQGFRLAASRNNAVKLSTSPILLFLDADALAAPDLVQEHLLTHRLVGSHAVVVGSAYGYLAKAEEIQEYLTSQGSNWWDHIDEVQTMVDWRMPVWSSINFRAEQLTEPWTMLIGNNFSVSREPFLSIGAFDETFTSWGAEDTDIAYRLHEIGIPYYINKNAAILHQPHKKESLREATNFMNKKQIYYKSPNLVTELLPFFAVTTYSQSIDEIKRLISQPLIPSYLDLWSDSFRSWVREMVIGPSSLIGGGDDGRLAEFLGCIMMTDPDQKKLDHVNHQYSFLTKCCLGVNFDMHAKTFEISVITDFWRAFNEKIVLGLISEIKRISRKTILLYTPEFLVPCTSSTPSWTPDNLSTRLQTNKMRLEELASGETTKVYEVVDRS